MKRNIIAFRNEYQERIKAITRDRCNMSIAERLKIEKQYKNLPGESYANKFAED